MYIHSILICCLLVETEVSPAL